MKNKPNKKIMNVAELEKLAGRKKPTERERIIAARIVVHANKATGVKTPEWIQELAKKESPMNDAD